MTGDAADWEPSAKAGFQSDDSFHRRNLRSLANFLRSPHIGRAQIRDLAVDTAKIDDLTVTDAKIVNLKVDKLTTGELKADVILSGKIATAADGQRVEIDINGIRLTDGTVETVTIPVIGEARFRGSIVASGLHVTDDASFAGMVGLELESVTTLASSVSQPVSAPGLAWVYETEATPPDADGDRKGLFYDAADNRWITVSGSADSVEAYDRAFTELAWSINPRTAASQAGRPVLFGYNVVGAIRENNNLWVVGRWLFNGKKYLLRFNGADDPGNEPTERFNLEPLIAAGDNLNGFGYDGTDLLVLFKNSSNALRVARYNTSGAHQSTTTLETGFTETALAFHAWTEGGADWWIVVDDEARGYTDAGARVASVDFPLATDSAGIAHDGTDFWSIPRSAQVVNKHSEWASTQTYIHVAYTYFAAGPKESTRSPVSYTEIIKRAFLRVSMPGVPTGADSLKVYALENALVADPALGASKLQDTVTDPGVDLALYSSVGAADPLTSTFTAAGTPASLKTQDAGFELRGDGYLILPKFASDPAGVEGRIYMNTTSHKARVHDGTTWNDLF